jgi:uncharacterized protein (TIGR02680 family)
VTAGAFDERDAGRAWLAAAAGGGLPEPGRERWQPLRVGIVGLWEYDDAEFWFADGRLVLRGGNGAGKTKILELTTLMLLRGEITAAVLDPFGSQHRTMRYNLLPTGDGDDPRPPADSGLGYAWVEFGRRAGDGEARFLVCGMGASARRGSGSGAVSTWHFVTERRPGKDFDLVAGGAVLDRKDLLKVDGVTLPPSATAYRARVADELFGLPPESYDNLTELLKQLRKPKLGERLNPASLAETLREALPPLAAQEVTQLAEGWERLEQLRRAVEQTEEAATSVAHFVRRGWRPWARLVVRARADQAVAATTTLDRTTRDRAAAESELEAAEESVRAVGDELRGARDEERDRRTELRELLDSQAYQDAVAAAGRVESLRADVLGRETALAAAEARSKRAGEALAGARTTAEQAVAAVTRVEADVERAAAELGLAAEPAGLADGLARHVPNRDVDALAAEHETRLERFARLRELHGQHSERDREATRSGDALQRAEGALLNARDEETAAGQALAAAAESLETLIRDWAAGASVTVPTPAVVDHWCESVAGLTVVDEDDWAVRPGPSVVEAMRRHVAAAREQATARAESARLERAPLAERLRQVDADLAELAAGVQAEPAAPVTWRRRHRPEPERGAGAPLWRLVNPVAGVEGDRLDLLEAALAASGLLDAWVSPDGHLSRDGDRLVADVQVRRFAQGRPAPGRSLLAVLEPDPAGGAGAVAADVVQAVLGGIGWSASGGSSVELHEPGTDWLAAEGTWRVGGLTGRAEAAGPASFLGTAAREAARERERARLEAERAELAARVDGIDRELAALAQALDGLADEDRAVPSAGESEVTQTTVRLAERGRARSAAERRAAAERSRHAQDVRLRDEAWASFADHAARHQFAVRDLRSQEEALQRFGVALARLTGEVRLLAARREQADGAAAQVREREHAVEAAEAEVADAVGGLRGARVRLATAEASLGRDHRERLDRRAWLDAEVGRLQGLIDGLDSRSADARVAAARAEEVLAGHESRRRDAEQARDAAAAALWETVDAGLPAAVGLAPPERRTVQSAREFAAAVRRDVEVLADAARQEQAWRRCYAELQALRQQLLPNRDAQVHEAEPSAEARGVEAGEASSVAPSVPRVVVLADPASGWQRPDVAADTLADRVREQRAGYDAEQQKVLTTLLESTFIEHLKDRLDYTTRTFARINDQLSRHPTRRGHLVRVLCEADPSDQDAGAVVAALGQGFHELTPERQAMVRSFLARRIDEAQAEATATGTADWKDELAQALDYRRWLRLSLQYRPGAGSPWAVFDVARHAAKSGGEKVVLLSQPLFAAAVVAFDAAGPQAPRWVWLDEAMTGVDAAVKSSFMGLTVEFDLDVMLTAHDEWCDYATVPAVAVFDLARHEHLPGVDAVPYLWCGGELASLDVDRIGVAATSPQLPADGLFAELAAGS